jgi:hypothetical protein
MEFAELGLMAVGLPQHPDRPGGCAGKNQTLALTILTRRVGRIEFEMRKTGLNLLLSWAFRQAAGISKRRVGSNRHRSPHPDLPYQLRFVARLRRPSSHRPGDRPGAGGDCGHHLLRMASFTMTCADRDGSPSRLDKETQQTPKSVIHCRGLSRLLSNGQCPAGVMQVLDLVT